MTQQKSGYGQGYRQPADTTKDRLRDMEDATTGKVKGIAGDA
jgi:hypothetical protein